MRRRLRLAGRDFAVRPLARDGVVVPAANVLGAASGDLASLRVELGWAVFLGVPVVMVPLGHDPVALAGVLSAHLAATPAQRVWVRAPADLASWRAWDVLRTLCDHDRRLLPCPVIGASAPAEQWLAEPVEGVEVDGDPRAAADFLRALFRRSATAALFGGPAEALESIFREAWAGVFDAEQFAFELKDQLTAPIQPLRDQVPNAAYEQFERGKEKYEKYAAAIRAALNDLRARAPVRVAVAGAGRGPLVTAALAAADALGVAVEVTAIERNPNAVQVLLRHGAAPAEWGGRSRSERDDGVAPARPGDSRTAPSDRAWARVRVIEGDMREVDARFDLVITELLGSFGDNELSPECLDGAERLLAPGGALIPRSSTSLLAPLSAASLWMGVPRALPEAEMPYGVTLSSARLLAAPVPCFTFAHPRSDRSASNERHAVLGFASEVTGVLHGFAGYFESALYGDVALRTHPSSTSWAPLFFPLRRPVRVEAGTPIAVSMWRRVEAHRVWYEWALVEPHPTALANAGGRSHTMGF